MILKEPLLLFLLLSGGIFLLFRALDAGEAAGQGDIVVSADNITAIAARFEKSWRRQPTTAELDGLIEAHIREEVLYREALALGLDRNDAVVRRRMRQKMAFLSEDLAQLAPPDRQELEAYLAAHPDKYRLPTTFSFDQIYFNVDERGDAAPFDAAELLAQLRHSDGIDPVELDVQADSISLERSFAALRESDVGRMFGAEFLLALRETPVGSWQGPIRSGYGLHLVRIHRRVDGASPALDEVHKAVSRDLMFEKRQQANETVYQQMRRRYTVTVQRAGAAAPADPVAGLTMLGGQQ